MTKKLFDEIGKIVKRGKIISKKEELMAYSYDGYSQGIEPNGVVLPGNSEEAVEVVAKLYKLGVPIIPRGAGTSLSGGPVPAVEGVILGTSLLNNIIEINQENMTAVVEAGVVLDQIQRQVKAKGLFYPPDPSSASVCTIGGNIAHDSAGNNALKYGTTRAFVLGLDVCTGNGTEIRLGANTIKHTTGYDIKDLFVGSEGTLGLILSATLRLIPLPISSKSIIAYFASPAHAMECVAQILGQGIMPSAMEYMDNTCIRITEEYSKVGMPLDAGSMLVMEVDGSEASTVEEIEKIQKICMEQGASGVEVGLTPEDKERIWRGRKSIVGALTRGKYQAVWEDFTVPRSKVGEAIQLMEKISKKHNVIIATFGHPGDGELHPTILVDRSNPVESSVIAKAIEDIFDAALELGGTLTGEHGVGIAKLHHMDKEVGRKASEIMRGIKGVIDPKDLFNPGKMWRG